MSERIAWRDRRLGGGGIALIAALVVGVGATAAGISAAIAGPAQSSPVTPEPASHVLRESAQVLDLTVHGRTVTCVYVSGQREGALSCDWEVR